MVPRELISRSHFRDGGERLGKNETADSKTAGGATRKRTRAQEQTKN